jgi:hypothetical protein
MAGLLKPFQPNPHKPLARISRKDLEALRARLSARGITLKTTLT